MTGISAANNGAGDAPTSLSKHHYRYSSRSNSLSSASVVTIKRAGSLSSTSPAGRNSGMPVRPQSPAEPLPLIALRVGRDHTTQDHRRRKSAVADAAVHDGSVGMGNLNRWSHDTNSSAASIGNLQRERTNSGAGLGGAAAGLNISPQKRFRVDPGEAERQSPGRKHLSSQAMTHRRKVSPDDDLTRLNRQPSIRPGSTYTGLSLPPLHTTPALVHSNEDESPSTTQTLQTPSTYSTYGQDYFDEEGPSPRSYMSGKKPTLVRTQTAPMSSADHARTPRPDASRDPLRNSQPTERREHTREHGSKSSNATDISDGSRPRTREGREKDKKQMLSKALAKANTAVLLDNAQNFEGALEAYTDACRLLQQVMDRSTAMEDKRKLNGIKITYTNRIEELEQLEWARPESSDGKTLPARPMSDDSMRSPEAVSPMDASVRDSAVIGTATITRIMEAPRLSYPAKQDRDSFFSRTMEAVDGSSRVFEEDGREPSAVKAAPELVSPIEQREEPRRLVARTLELPPVDSRFMPAPLSPRRVSPKPQVEPEEEASEPEPERAAESEPVPEHTHQSSDTNDQAMTWLDTIDESASSCASSMHSKSSPNELRRKAVPGVDATANPDFDTVFDEAVEAAYDEGLEPDTGAQHGEEATQILVQKEAVGMPIDTSTNGLPRSNDYRSTDTPASDLDDEEEERLLDEITSDYAQGFNFDLSSKSALPRQSDSSGYSRSTWQSSQASTDRTTAATSLSTVAEDTLSARIGALEKVDGVLAALKGAGPDGLPLASAPPSIALPRPPSFSTSRLSTSVRDRRRSGQSGVKQLIIETAPKLEGRQRASTLYHSPTETAASDERTSAVDNDATIGASLEPTRSETLHEHVLMSPPSLDMRSGILNHTQVVLPSPVQSRRGSDGSPGELRTIRPGIFRRNKSSVSLRDPHALPSPEDGTPLMTPMSSTFTSFSTRRGHDIRTPLRANFSSVDTGVTGRMSNAGTTLFDTSLLSAQAPTSPRSPTSSATPMGLEPCPESVLLRPFWLMRCISSTLTHPRGGFLTTRLFVPREAWQTRGVRLKSLEDKVSSCDLLTAALVRLARVDTYDADAVMDELQCFEEIMERVQAGLSKKLGSDVGVHGVSALFRDAASAGVPNTSQGFDATAGAERTSKSKEGRSYLTSWRKLRSKSSGTPLAMVSAGRTGEKEQLSTMSSVPMTSFVPVERRGPKRDASFSTPEGPNKDYCRSLAELFDGVQILGKSFLFAVECFRRAPAVSRVSSLSSILTLVADQIARQVEDPGLKHSSPTHVGLELSIRHAAEFFGFYVCRFVLADLGILLDKYVKRGTEWVLA